jgi:hypothetical protein
LIASSVFWNLAEESHNGNAVSQGMIYLGQLDTRYKPNQMVTTSVDIFSTIVAVNRKDTCTPSTILFYMSILSTRRYQGDYSIETDPYSQRWKTMSTSMNGINSTVIYSVLDQASSGSVI